MKCACNHEALESPGESVLLEKGRRKDLQEFVYLYPPGNSYAGSGVKIISREVLGKIRRLVREGYSVQEWRIILQNTYR